MSRLPLFVCAAFASSVPWQAPEHDAAPPSRALLLELTAQPRLAGTSGSLRAARFVGRVLEQAGWIVEYDEREVLLSMLASTSFAVFPDATSKRATHERSERFDADAVPAGDVPPYSAWSASGSVRGPVVDAGHGQRSDFERLRRLGVTLEGSVALVRYGSSYRGVKVELATEFGCAAVLLFNDPAEDGAGKGPTWPEGPWKPDTSAQRGSISPMNRAPGDPTTPGWGSPAPGAAGERKPLSEIASSLPRILCVPIGAREAELLLQELAEVQVPEGETGERRLGPGPVEVGLGVDAPRELRAIRSVIATLAGRDARLVLAGNHRDAWVRGAHDAGSGTVALLRAAQHLGARAKAGWRPEHTLILGFWDAEEFGLIGSTEWGEANAQRLRRDGLVYVNADAAVSGTQFNASGSPGLLHSLLGVLDREPGVAGASVGGASVGGTSVAGASVGAQWRESFGERPPSLPLPGSGSDFAVFLHHLALPVIDFSFGGNPGGQYHTEFDDFPMVERYLDPGFVGHELAGLTLAHLLAAFADDDDGGFDDAEAALAAAEIARAAGAENAQGGPWLGSERGERLALAFEALAARAGPRRGERTPGFYSALADEQGLPGRPWYRNPLWAPGLETGYSSETLPTLRAAAARGPTFLDAELDRLLTRVALLTEAWPPSDR